MAGELLEASAASHFDDEDVVPNLFFIMAAGACDSAELF
jgi:hypothetical protein